MSQQIRVLKCFQCNIFQVDIVKKTRKWQCKVCNNKQTVREEYFRGSGAKCREKVMELNLKKGKEDTDTERSFFGLLDELNECNKTTEEECNNEDEFLMVKNYASTQNYLPNTKLDQKNIRDNSQYKTDFCAGGKKSKWDDYV